jgi:hypothetical protein
LGADFIRAKGYELVDINRDLELVPGQLDSVPQGAGVVFAPERLFGYNADMFVEVSYEGESLLRSRFNVRELPTFINGVINDQFGQPLRGIEVSLPDLGRSAQTNGDGGFTFGYQETGDKVIPAGSYKIIANDNFKNPSFGTIDTVVSIQRNRVNTLKGFSLQELDTSVSFYTLKSGVNNSLVGGDLEIDLTNARALFANTRTSGAVHAQFLPLEHAGVAMYQFSIPHWLFGLQPKGIKIEGEVSLKMKIPMLRGSYDYIDPENYEYVVLLGYSSAGQVVEPIGVAKIENLSVISVGKVHLNSLDYIAYAVVPPSATQDLSDYATGKIGLLQLKAALQAIKLPTE